MDKAIKKAIKGGYKKTILLDVSGYPYYNPGAMQIRVVFMDNLFWEALGKAEGWGGIGTSDYPQSVYHPYWKINWHKFIDHLAEGKDIESFFIYLLEK